MAGLDRRPPFAISLKLTQLRSWHRRFALALRRDPITRAMVSDLVTYLPGDLLAKVDLASMAHSLECRGPFLDHRVVELAMAMPIDRKIRFRQGRSKVILKQAFSDLLPPPIKTRSKMGFGVPISRWFRNELKNELKEVLLDPVCLNRGIFRPAAIENLVAEHIRSEREHSNRLWALLMLELWFRQYMDPRPPPSLHDHLISDLPLRFSSLPESQCIGSA